MTDDETRDDGTPDAQASDQQALDQQAAQPTRRTTAAASAASRARRIGGARPSAAPTASSGTAPAPSVADGAVGAPTPAAPAEASGAKPVSVGTPETDEKAATDQRTEKDRVTVEVPAWLRWAPAGVLSVCAIVMIVLIVVAGHGTWYSKPSGSAVRDQVLAAAKTCIAATNTYSYQTLTQDEAKGLACATGDWSHQYRKAITTIVRPSATKLKASQSVQINNAGIETISGNGQQWTVVVFGQTKIAQSGKKARLDPFSAEVTMRHVGGKWLISKIDTIVNPSG